MPGSLSAVTRFGGMAQNEFSVSSSTVVNAPAEAVFAVLADPRKHSVIDGSGTVQGEISGPERLVLGSKFGMRMRRGIGYRITNTVVEYEENRLIAWRHMLPARWRYELEPEGDSATRVTETFDYAAMLPKLVARTGLPGQNLRSIEATLQRLKSHVEENRG
ncbi:Polyketide cyclase / dehydrase and lipid transport [Saccharopolyspora antimicrobica]|uniref:Polyketide cyclase / dehydrase and lipid transport n=2 Tax=Saccharopolyspora antimicrobica TaxID=455193 RepID=A0A1I5KBQ9_9PSEU|nr:polyketide cyclase/dehydrase/lipid transport protein [Saccharopolyspora antimicrobica]SFO82469.1 Polyketide cyclase / dehydrase and lipid transport [Saccharopolyspora antimicrobica]